MILIIKLYVFKGDDGYMKKQKQKQKKPDLSKCPAGERKQNI